MVEREGGAEQRRCIHRTNFKARDEARAEARRMSRNLGARISPMFCQVCEHWYVGASRERGAFDQTDLQILKFLTIGLRDRDMAIDLHVAEFVIRKRVSSMFERTDTNSRAQLVAYALHVGAVSNYGELMEGKSHVQSSGRQTDLQ